MKKSRIILVCAVVVGMVLIGRSLIGALDNIRAQVSTARAEVGITAPESVASVAP